MSTIIITDSSDIERIKRWIRNEFDSEDSFITDIQMIDMAKRLGFTELAQEMEKESLEAVK